VGRHGGKVSDAAVAAIAAAEFAQQYSINVSWAPKVRHFDPKPLTPKPLNPSTLHSYNPEA
jgi:hypothetical protein